MNLRRRFGRSSGGIWTPADADLLWAFGGALSLTLSGSNITVASSVSRTAKNLAAASGKEPVVDVGNATQWNLDRTNGPFTGKSSICTSNVDTKLFSATGGPTGASPFHIISIAEYRGLNTGTTNLGNFCTFGAPSSAYNTGFGEFNSANFSFGGNASSAFTFGAVDTNPHIFEASYDGTNVRIYIDGKLATTQARTHNIASADFGFMNWWGVAGYHCVSVRASGHAFDSKRLSQDAVNRFLRYEMARLSGPTGRPRIVAMYGDSTVQGNAVGAEPLDQSLRLQQVAPNIIYPANYGVSGERPDQIATRLSTFDLAATHIAIWCGRNLQLVTTTPEADAAIAYESIRTMVARAHALGCKAIVGTLPQWGNATPGSYSNNYRLAFNVLILANSAGADAIALISEAMGAYNAANFCADTLHENITCERTLVAPAFYAALLTC